MNCFILFDTCAGRSHIFVATKIDEAGSRKFCFDENKIIRDHKINSWFLPKLTKNKKKLFPK
ncbi:MAG: hypothetical protein A3A96_02950 [Candidatus Zambryskibacteria bacterium RIFCSPLOWO2_01_FULL_39_39]|uniref:Uncharacterized protein n=1 Tax=Candidatus Zambryskibacteria bacterium RIFCSPLOWO2_01_FULL_39_39 TaxID=1802758 RepID=A0A1G2TWD8_9BACT|nr:MAG: hypothetical protein UT00_C0002G0034 [Parcubacteria group bacterium GW2011_GWA1_38_7]OHA86879.1 MAG: hypothetical protein A2644_00150 [Candidatus Zambryskibacteria bacterium RIFCSPHIGHO2_01_FULL_39_63]OHA94445.1 MAG: hypothetical protein A3B88_01970 [Candidatus Zambryskibacteria bacterium RIFCSPHIGHO2_02_FULL_39_19]OHA98976.1 MAG: hypothetical protein A3F20_00295 [Candidatus Zambryskibacteria bacterium RIFCSPHIGHO2_12_FULL_39_21]OHB01601.1 MAG: hypothetical protein A3A96_02950 [Candidat